MAQNNNNKKILTPYLRNCTSYDCGFWYTCLKWWYLQQCFFHFFKILIFQKFQSSSINAKRKFWGVPHLIKTLELGLMVVSVLLNIKFRPAQISVCKIGVPMSKTACVNKLCTPFLSAWVWGGGCWASCLIFKKWELNRNSVFRGGSLEKRGWLLLFSRWGEGALQFSHKK